jgi:hypothetical protein
VATNLPDPNNSLFQLAANLVNQSSRNIFLTGKAGTGKTTFLKYIRENCPKQIAVVAPTGVAAINAGGVTIHSFFQLPFSPFIPEVKDIGADNNGVSTRNSLIGRLKINSEKRKLLQELELLIIDEISMVRCDLLDAIDAVLRFIRKRPYERFGGVQVLFIGDMFQLPPVIKDQEWSLLSRYYESPYFFESHVIREDPPVYIEFDKIYRQSEEQFIRLLNQVRNNELEEDGLNILESRFDPSFRRIKQDGYIILTTHNERAREINATELKNLEGQLATYKADIEGEFSENAFPADELLILKPGAQVMFIKNDTEKSKRYFNGKIGVITKLEEEKIYVQCGDEPEIEVKKEKWENIRYTVNKTTRVIEDDVLGSFTQFPLRLAWAITIHKSQGLTFEKAIIDAGAAFAPGQVYVALSRCTSLAGMVLQSRIRSSSLRSDERIVQFSRGNTSAIQLKTELEAGKRKHLHDLLSASFDLRVAYSLANDTLEFLLQHTSSFNKEAFTWMGEIPERLGKLQHTAAKFQLKLNKLFEFEAPESNPVLEERLGAASRYFVAELDALINLLASSQAITDSRMHAKVFNDGIKELFAQLSLKKFLLEGFNGIPDIDSFYRRKKGFVLPGLAVNAYAGSVNQQTESPHPDLYQQLKKLRDSICLKKDIPVYLVAGSKSLEEMARFLPLTPSELEQINGFGKAKVEKYGQQFLEIIKEYCEDRSLTSSIAEKLPKRVRKTKTAKVDTKAQTFGLYKEGKTVSEIARIRGLAESTIEGHIAYYIETGDITIHELIEPERVIMIEELLEEARTNHFTYIREKLGDAVQYKEIKWVMAARKLQKSKS